MTRRAQASILTAAGIAIVIAGFALPAPNARIAGRRSRLDDFLPEWQFDELHALDIAAAPARVYDAIHAVRADEITLFRLLTWIRRGGRPLPPGILNAAIERPLLDVATSTTFVTLADDRPNELVVGTVVVAPRGVRGRLTPEVFTRTMPPGFALAGMNFVVTPDGRGGSHVTTETRVFATDASTRRRFAAYWRVIYPGSALIRSMWLRAIARRAEKEPVSP